MSNLAIQPHQRAIADLRTARDTGLPSRCIHIRAAQRRSAIAAVRALCRTESFPASLQARWIGVMNDFFDLTPWLRDPALWGAGVRSGGDGWEAVRGNAMGGTVAPDVFGSSVVLFIDQGPTLVLEDLWP